MARRKPQPQQAPARDKVRRVQMIAPHGFIDERGVRHFWHERQIVDDPEHIAILSARHAHFQDIEP